MELTIMKVNEKNKGVLLMNGQQSDRIVRTSSRIRKKGQITITKEILQALGADEGDEIQFKVENGVLVGIPVVTVQVPKEQAWYWSEAWQAKEKYVDQWIEDGGLQHKSAQTADELIADLERRAKRE
jgi:bifunctional DNA-binding transcriptional regulator/antitoxin component of YhaV-PrlF toxin-antitoxin module